MSEQPAPADGSLGDALTARIEARRAELSPAERRFVDHLLAHPTDALFLSAVELAQLSRTSDATVVRTAKKLGFAGLPELKQELGGELLATTHPARRLASRITAARQLTSRSLVDRIVEEGIDRLAETGRRFDDADFDRAADQLVRAGTVYTFGVGLSRVVAEYLAMRLNRIGASSYFASQMGFALADDLVRVGGGDCVVLFAPGRIVPEIEVILRHCRSVGATTVVVTDSLRNELGDAADVYLPAPLSVGGLTGEALAASVVADALMLALAQREEQRATERSKSLTALRRELGAKGRR